MIERLELRDFQAHKKLVIDFDPRITVVVGDSDVGKSAIIRALAWVMLNKPNGDAFIRHGAKAAIATLEVDGQVIVRCRGSGENTYNLNSDEFKAFGNAVPERVAELLRVADINFQLQHDAPFWFSESAGEVSRRLNHVINLGVIDDVLGDVAGQVRKARAAVEFCEDRAKKAKQVKEDLKAVIPADAALKEVEEAELRMQSLIDRGASLRLLIEGLSKQELRAENARKAARRGATLLALAEEALTAQGDAAQLQRLTATLITQRKAMRVKLPPLEELTALKTEHDKTQALRERLAVAIERLRELWRARKDANDAYKLAHDTFHKQTDGMACPLCGGHHK